MGKEEEACSDGGKKAISEGEAEVLISSSRNVFYNPVQEFNRDLRYVQRNITTLNFGVIILLYSNMCLLCVVWYNI
jgi:tRNA G26 N,N-dimethylase Trm1